MTSPATGFKIKNMQIRTIGLDQIRAMIEQEGDPHVQAILYALLSRIEALEYGKS